VTPAIETGVRDQIWEITEITGLLDWAASTGGSDAN